MKPDNAPAAANASPADALASDLALVALRLHGIASRTDPSKVTAEVLRLNDAVRAGSRGRLGSDAHPQDFAALLLAASDPVNTDPAA